MGFTLRFMLGLALVLATCSLFECATTWRRIRQVPPIEASPEAGTLHDDGISNKNVSIKEEESINKNASSKENLQPISDKERVEKNEVEKERKPKTETSTEKYTVDNVIPVNKTNDNDKLTTDRKFEHKNVTSIEKPLVKTTDLVAEDAKQNFVSKEVKDDEQKKVTTTEKVPENIQDTSVSRADNGRSLGIDISKYVSPEFHNKNNVYSFSISPDTEKFTNLHNELPKSTTSRLSLPSSRLTSFEDDITTPVDDNFDKKYQHIEEGVKQKLEYIDQKFLNADYEFKKSSEDPLNISKLIDETKNNDTAVKLNFIKYKNITNSNSEIKNQIHKELDLESGQNIDYTSSYNKTQIFDEPPKDYKNKIPIHEEEILSETLPEHSDTKLTQKSPLKPVESKHLESETVPEITNHKDSTTLTKPPPLNQTENHKLLLSNKIETEVVNSAENGKMKLWDLLHISTPATSVASKEGTSSGRPGQKEKAVYVPYNKDNSINVSKRGSTKYIDTIKIPPTTESYTTNRNPATTMTTLAYRNKLTVANKEALAHKENKTLEQAVLENQVFPVQIPAPNKNQKEEQTSEKMTTKEDSTLSLKLHTVSHNSNLSQTTIQNIFNFENQTEITTAAEIVDERSELTTQTTENSIEYTTILSTTPMEQTATYNSITELTTNKEELDTTTMSSSENSILVSESETFSTTLSSTTLETELTTTSMIGNIKETTTTNEVDISTVYSMMTVNSQTISSEEPHTSISTTNYPDESTTSYSYENSGSTSMNISDYYTDYDDRASNGRDLKDNLNTTNDNVNNIDDTTQPMFSISSTTEQIMQLNKTNVVTEGFAKTTNDYRENIIIKHPDTTTTKSPGELLNKYNITDEGEDVTGEDVPDDYTDTEHDDHLNTSSRNIKPHAYERTSDTTPFIIPLNVSLLETEGTDSTTIADSSELEEEEKADGNGGKIAAIVISCIGAVCLIILAGLLFIMRKRHKRFNYGQRCTPVSLDAYSVDNVSVYNSVRRKGAVRASKRSYGNPAFDDPSSVSHPLNFQGLAKFASDIEGIGKEFEEIPQVTAQTNELPEGCETKNRYANVIPLPETRVFLNAIDGYPNSDYINANFVTGPKSSKGYYIACQAPMQNTVDDFWRMVWEQQSKVILMLTHLFENGSEKCADYLPPSEVLDCHRLFGDFQVTLKKREVKEKYVISILQLKNMVSNSWREVTHLWYLGWPEKGVPLEANSLIAFLIEARSYIKAAPTSENGKPMEVGNKQVNNGTVSLDQNPVIVHCSPGTGRTGTVIACDITIREFELARQVDIPKTVYRIRRDRGSSVQTKEQYTFIYTVICLYATKLTGGVLDSL